MISTAELKGAGFKLPEGSTITGVTIVAGEASVNPKPNRHISIALGHLNKRRDVLLLKRAAIEKEIGEIDQAILALE